MARHRRYSVEFKRRVAQEHLAPGETLGATLPDDARQSSPVVGLAD